MNTSNPELSISEAVLNASKENLNKTAITYFSKSISYKSFLYKVERLAVSLFSLGIKKGDIVLVALPNVPQAVFVLYALNRIGAVPAFVSPLSAQAELEQYIEKCNCQFVIALDSLYEKLMSVFAATGDKTLILTSAFDELFLSLKKPKPKAVWWNTLLKKKVGNIYISPQKADDTAVILFSGGTTGTPKAVELTNLNLNALAIGTEAVCEGEVRGIKMLSVLPVFHGFGLGICIHTVLFFGGNALLAPRFDSHQVGRIIAKHKPQYLACVPAMLNPLINAKSLSKADLSCLLGVFSGGDSLDSELQKNFNKFLKEHGADIKIRQGYGLTECVAASCLMPELEQRSESVGKPYPDTLYKIVNQKTCDELSFGEVGEICISGKTVMKGYLEDIEETQNVLKKHSDGLVWLHTGDMGCIDKDGFVYFKGRLKRIIVTNGHNVYPTEIEKAMLSHPEVKACCAVGVKDSRKIQTVALFVVMDKKDNECEEKKVELLHYLENYVSRQARPEYLYFIASIPQTPLGKVAYTELEKLAEDNIK